MAQVKTHVRKGKKGNHVVKAHTRKSGTPMLDRALKQSNTRGQVKKVLSKGLNPQDSAKPTKQKDANRNVGHQGKLPGCGK